jgi:hypothetical protein
VPGFEKEVQHILEGVITALWFEKEGQHIMCVASDFMGRSDSG